MLLRMCVLSLTGCLLACSSSGEQGRSGTNELRSAGSGGTNLVQDSESATLDGADFGAAPTVFESLGASGDDEASDNAPADENCEEGMRCYDNAPDKEDCGKQLLNSDVTEVEEPGNVLLIYDRSGSMNEDWAGVPKFQAAGEALMAAFEPLKGLLTVGSQFFPSVANTSGGCTCNLLDPTHWVPGPMACCLNSIGSSCNVTPITEPDQISFRPANEFLQELPNQWVLQGAGQTPLQAGLEQAQVAIENANLNGSLTIIIVTDGAPNCGTDPGTVLAQVDAWRQQGYRTYVVGLPGAGGAADLLNELAKAGGSGRYVDPGDPTVLETELRDILLSTVRAGIESCTIQLNPPAEAPKKLHLVVEVDGTSQDVARDLSDTASWRVSDDGAEVVLEGDLCDNAKAGAYDTLRFEFGCVDLPPLPPPMAPE